MPGFPFGLPVTMVPEAVPQQYELGSIPTRSKPALLVCPVTGSSRRPAVPWQLVGPGATADRCSPPPAVQRNTPAAADLPQLFLDPLCVPAWLCRCSPGLSELVPRLASRVTLAVRADARDVTYLSIRPSMHMVSTCGPARAPAASEETRTITSPQAPRPPGGPTPVQGDYPPPQYHSGVQYTAEPPVT